MQSISVQFPGGLADTIELLDASLSVNSSNHFVPHYWSDILPENPRHMVIQNKFRCTDLLIGNTVDEGRLQVCRKIFLKNR